MAPAVDHPRQLIAAGAAMSITRITRHRNLILFFICILIYYPSFNADFVFDDISAIVNNADIRTNESSWFNVFIHDYWGSPIDHEVSHKSYRPLTVLTFRLNFLIDHLNPFGYHLVNVLLHALVCILLARVSESVVFSHQTSPKTANYYATLSAVIFATHPIHTEAVVGVVGRAELLSALFFLSSLLSYHKHWYFISACLTVISTFCKEQGITALGVVVVYELTHGGKKSPPNVKRISLFTLVALVTITFRIWIMGGRNSLPVFTRFDNPASFSSYPTRQLTYLYLVPLNLLLLLYPFNLCCDWTMQSVPLVKNFADQRNLATLIAFTVIFILTLKCLGQCIDHWSSRKGVNCGPPLPLLVSLAILPYIPSSNLIHPVGFVLAERVLYLPSIGFILILTYGLKHLQSHLKSAYLKLLMKALLVLLVISFAGKTLTRSSDWLNEKTLFTSAIRVNPNNAKLYNNLGHYYEKQRHWSEALKCFSKAHTLQPDDLGTSINIARTYLNMGDPVQAETILWSVKPKVMQAAKKNDQRIAPNYLSLWINLGNIISQNDSRLAEAEVVFRELIAMRADFVDAYINLGGILVKQQKLVEAKNVYETALTYGSKTSDLYYNLAVVESLILQNERPTSNETLGLKVNEISTNFLKSIGMTTNKDALINLAIMVQTYPQFMGELKETIKKLLEDYKGPEEERMWFNLALIYADEGNNLMAEQCLRKSIDIREDFVSALFNLAVILYEEERLFEAEIYLTKLLSFDERHRKSLLLLTEIFHKFGQLDKAEEVRVKYNVSH